MFVDGAAHTNNLENVWSLFKRGLKGTAVCVSREHLGRYAGEEEYRRNTRKDGDGGGFVKLASRIEGKRLTYRKLTATRAGRGPAKGYHWR